MPVNQTEDLLEFIKNRNKEIFVKINKCNLSDSDNWFYDKSAGEIRNKNRSFFQIKGLKKYKNGECVLQQPVIIQDEIGFLGIVCCMIDGQMHYLMQAKIEPGNINNIQLSPTIQATKSNFTQKHGGKKPEYLDCFLNVKNENIIVDQIQSEQSSRFYKKRNRNIIIEVDSPVEALENYKWMTLKQIKELMRYDNLVNMDARTVLSCIPVEKMKRMGEFKDEAFLKSTEYADSQSVFNSVTHCLNDIKMFDDDKVELVPLDEISNWNISDKEIVCNSPYSFKVVFCDIEIEGREVRKWTQPLFEATGTATFGLFTCVDEGVRKFLVKAKKEAGCFDSVELGPTVQREYINTDTLNKVDILFNQKSDAKENIIFDTMLSEEGGRFYHEENRNIIIEIDKNETGDLPEGYFWADYKTLNRFISVNNCLNIQLRNLLSVLEW